MSAGSHLDRCSRESKGGIFRHMNGTYDYTKLHQKGFYRVDHSDFGGKICYSDFNRKITMAEMAERIMADRRFNELCGKNLTERQRREHAVNE